MTENKITFEVDKDLLETLKRLARAMESADFDPKTRPATTPAPYPWWSPPPFPPPHRHTPATRSCGAVQRKVS